MSAPGWRRPTSQLRSSDPQLTSLTQIFNEVLWNGLDMSGSVRSGSKKLSTR